MNHTCPHCQSTWTEFDPTINMHWCNDCQRWDDVGDEDEQSQSEIHASENAAFDKSERR